MNDAIEAIKSSIAWAIAVALWLAFIAMGLAGVVAMVRFVQFIWRITA